MIYIVDDDAALGVALDRLFRSVGLRTRHYTAARDFLGDKPMAKPACLILDIRLPGSNGLDLQVELAEMGVKLPVIFVTGYADVPMTVRAMKAGAVDLLQKPFRDQDLLDAVSLALAIDKSNSDELRKHQEIQRRYDTLSPRERQVMARVSAGQVNKRIAGELGLSEITVKVHRGAVMRKMEARTVADLVRMADLIAS